MPAPKGHPPYPGCETGGRPLEWTPERIEIEADALMEWVENPKSWWFMDHCCERRIPKDLFAQLAKRNEKFRSAYVLARQKQEAIVSKGCVTKKLDGHFGWRFLSANYKWKEESDTSGLEENSDTPGSRKLAETKQVCIEHADSIEQAGS